MHCLTLLLVVSTAALRMNTRAMQKFLTKENTMPLCKGEEYTTGSWVQIDKLQSNFKCCSLDSGRNLIENSDKYCSKGRPVPGLEWAYDGTVPEGKFVKTPGNSCLCGHDFPNQLEKYEWQPSTCQLPSFSADSFCTMLGERRLLMVGDSTAQQLGSTIMNLIIAQGGKCASQVQVRLTDTLMPSSQRMTNLFPQYDYDRAHNQQWADKRPEKEFGRIKSDSSTEQEQEHTDLILQTLHNSTVKDIVVISAGAHFRSAYGYSFMLKKIKEKIKQKQQDPNYNAKLLWKTTAGCGCGEVNEFSTTFANTITTNCKIMPKLDQMAAETMKELSVPILNVSMLYARGDARSYNHDSQVGDCIHFCTPGPLDDVTRMLQHVIQEQF